MADKLDYRGLVIVAAPQKLADGRWNHNGHILEQLPNLTKTHILHCPGTSSEHEEAVQAAFACGRKFIDAKLAERNINAT